MECSDVNYQPLVINGFVKHSDTCSNKFKSKFYPWAVLQINLMTLDCYAFDNDGAYWVLGSDSDLESWGR